jgi:disulfide bond formation protein DsbB
MVYYFIMKEFKKYILHIAFLQALIATLGSLFFSEIMNFTPCVLCWYQRIAMYPLVFILAVGIIREDKKVHEYVLPLSITGWFIALYHNLLYYKILPQSFETCKNGVSCTTKYFQLFGIFTIPSLAFIAFTVITILMFVYRKNNK